MILNNSDCRINIMKRYYLKFYRYVLNNENYPLNLWALFFVNALKIFLSSLVLSCLFLNFYFNSSLVESLKYSYVFAVLSIPVSILIYFNPLEFLKFIYDTTKKLLFKMK